MVAARMSLPDRAMRKQVWGPIDDGDQVFPGGGGDLIQEGGVARALYSADSGLESSSRFHSYSLSSG